MNRAGFHLRHLATIAGLLFFSIFPAELIAQAVAPLDSAGLQQAANAKQADAKSSDPAQSANPGAGAPKIQDNSFLVEEAYNQEFGVVQHIQNFQRYWNSKDWAYTFTQEWPVDPSPRHQLSYTLAALHLGQEPASGGGFGDVFLNYRYQLLGNGESKLAFAPRFSVLLPTGDYRQGRSFGGVGIQGSLPLSVVVSHKVVTHWNLGTTIIPRAKNPLGETASAFGYNFGQSFVWLARPRFNALLETVFIRAQRVTAPDRAEWGSILLLSPGVRWAYNFKNGLQIVPGVAVPVGLGPSSGEKGIFVYLSFEHPYRARR